MQLKEVYKVMFRKINKNVFKLLATAFALIAATEIKTASFFMFYQPQAPKSLTK